MKKVLIIKTGYSEILEERNNSRKVSLGDVIRTTPLLHLYKESHATWVTDFEAFPLLENNPYISKLLPYDFTTVLQLQSEEFDTVINLEKIPGICALSDRIRARRNKYGFTFNSQTGNAEAYDNAFEVLAVSSDIDAKKKNKRTPQELLFEMVGAKWQGEEYILGYKPKTAETYDVGLNTKVGSKWPTKVWEISNWDGLEKKLINEGFKTTRQDKQENTVLSDLRKYMDWINSCKLIVSSDTLGLHLAIAMKKKVIGLFGPTSSDEVYFYGRGEPILPEPRQSCSPCFEGKCARGESCMEDISIESVYHKIKKLLNSDSKK